MNASARRMLKEEILQSLQRAEDLVIIGENSGCSDLHDCKIAIWKALEQAAAVQP